MDTKAKIRLGSLILLATAVLNLILVLIVDSQSITIPSTIVIMAATAGGLVWTLCHQQRQFIECLKKFGTDPEKGRVNEANLHRMYHSDGQAQKDAITLIYLLRRCSVDGAHAMLEKRPTHQEVNQMAMQQSKGRRRLHRWPILSEAV